VFGEPRCAPLRVPFSTRLAFSSGASFAFGAVDHGTIPFLRCAERQVRQFEKARAMPFGEPNPFRWQVSAFVRSNAVSRIKNFRLSLSALLFDSDRVGKFLDRRTTFWPVTDCGPRNGSVRRSIHLETINFTPRGGRIKEIATENASTNRRRKIVRDGDVQISFARLSRPQTDGRMAERGAVAQMLGIADRDKHIRFRVVHRGVVFIQPPTKFYASIEPASWKFCKPSVICNSPAQRYRMFLSKLGREHCRQVAGQVSRQTGIFRLYSPTRSR
jgi:hypothetical protein